MKNNIYVLKIDSNFDDTFNAFKKQLAPGEEIINTSISETKLVVTTKTNKPTNLLTDELRRK